jgi:SAM-dependent methyltransferase
MPDLSACYLCGATRLARRSPNPEYSMLICLACGYRRQDPIPKDGELEILYHSEFYQDRGLDKGLDEQPKFNQQLIGRRVEALTRLSGGPGWMLDVGCGTGLFLEAARRAGWEVVGTETSEASLAYAQRFTSARLFRGELSDFAADRAYDAVTFWDVLEHLPDPRAELKRAAAMLRTGGIVGISLPNVSGAKARLRASHWRYYQPSMGHISHFSPSTLSRLLTQAGLPVAEVHTEGAFNLWKPIGLDPLSARERHPALDRGQRLVDSLAGSSGLGETITAFGRRPERPDA